jgi:hypothetical protein
LEWSEVAAGVFVLVLLAACVAMIAVDLNTKRKCLSLGYRDSQLSWAFDRYCVARVDQTDLVVPLSEAQRFQRR